MARLKTKMMRNGIVALLAMTVVALPSWLSAAVPSVAAGRSPMDSGQADTLTVDTLREVEVLPNIKLPVSGSLKRDVDLLNWQNRNSLGGLLERVSPMLHDQMMHPFGFKERKKTRKRKKVKKVLEEYDAVGRSDLEYRMMLDSVVNAEQHR